MHRGEGMGRGAEPVEQDLARNEHEKRGRKNHSESSGGRRYCLRKSSRNQFVHCRKRSGRHARHHREEKGVRKADAPARSSFLEIGLDQRPSQNALTAPAVAYNNVLEVNRRHLSAVRCCDMVRFLEPGSCKRMACRRGYTAQS